MPLKLPLRMNPSHRLTVSMGKMHWNIKPFYILEGKVNLSTCSCRYDESEEVDNVTIILLPSTHYVVSLFCVNLYNNFSNYFDFSSQTFLGKGQDTYNQTTEEVQVTKSRATAKCQQKHIVTNITLSCISKSHCGPLKGYSTNPIWKNK